MNEQSLATGIVLFIFGGIIGGISWRVIKVLLFSKNSTLPPNGTKSDEEIWLEDLRRRVTELESDRDEVYRMMSKLRQQVIAPARKKLREE